MGKGVSWGKVCNCSPFMTWQKGFIDGDGGKKQTWQLGASHAPSDSPA